MSTNTLILVVAIGVGGFLIYKSMAASKAEATVQKASNQPGGYGGGLSGLISNLFGGFLGQQSPHSGSTSGNYWGSGYGGGSYPETSYYGA